MVLAYPHTVSELVKHVISVCSSSPTLLFFLIVFLSAGWPTVSQGVDFFWFAVLFSFALHPKFLLPLVRVSLEFW